MTDRRIFTLTKRKFRWIRKRLFIFLRRALRQGKPQWNKIWIKTLLHKCRLGYVEQSGQQGKLNDFPAQKKIGLCSRDWMPKMNCCHKTFLIVEITTKFPFLVGRRENDKNNKTSNAHVFRHSLALEAVKLVYCLRAINSSPVSIIFRRWRVQATVAVNGHKYVFLHIWIIIFGHLAK